MFSLFYYDDKLVVKGRVSLRQRKVGEKIFGQRGVENKF